MRLKTLLLAGLAAGAAAHCMTRAQRARRSRDWQAAAETAAQSDEVMSAASPITAAALNPAEGLEANNSLGSPIGEGTPLAEASEGEDLFDSSSQHGSSTPVMTGLPDFSRGA